MTYLRGSSPHGAGVSGGSALRWSRSEGGDGPCGSGPLEKKEGLEELGGMGEGEINRREPTMESLYPDSLKRPPNKRSTERKTEKKMSILNNRHL